jgi:hypothetical protein
MKNLPGLIVIVTVLGIPGAVHAAKSACEFSLNTVDEQTGERIIQTEFDPVITGMSFAPSEATGAISVLLTGGQKYLAIKFDAIDHFPLPDQFADHEDPNWDPAYRDFLDSLLGDTAIFPAGSKVRLDLDDQTSVTLAREQHLRVRTHYAEPGGSVSSRSSKTKSAKKLVGFLAKMAGEDVNTNADASRYYTVATKAILKFPIDDESADILGRAAVTGLRIEARDRYYTMGYRTARYFVGWSSKSYLKIQEAMNCVDAANKG